MFQYLMKIPEITDARLAELAAKISPVIARNGILFWMVMPDMRKTAFTWDPKIKGPAFNLVEIGKVDTLHSFAYHGFFKPSVAEVLSQFPDELIPKAVAFSTAGPDDVHDLNRNKEALNAGFHVAVTTVYGKASPIQKIFRFIQRIRYRRVIGLPL